MDADSGSVIADAVTGALPRAVFDWRLQAELSRSIREGVPCSLFLFDVDYFKSVNDSYGHQRGDEILRMIADRVRARVRRQDELFRYGGDEFVLLLPGTDRDDAVRLALAVVDDVKSRTFPGTPPLQVSVSLGVATYPVDAVDAEALLAVADRRNYAAKARGRAVAVADDDAAGPAESSRLVEREGALAAVNDLLHRLDGGGAEALVVRGEPGAGHTRFLTEVRRIAGLRGFAVLDAGGPAAVPDGDRVVVLADVEAAAGVAALVERVRPGVRELAVVVAENGVSRHDVGVPRGGEVQLEPWSPGALQAWLRSALQAEPSNTLISFLHRAAGGLPGLAARELERLRDTGGLAATPGGGQTITSAGLARHRGWAALPVPVTQLVGREAERDRVLGLLGSARLVTLAGPGGIGKTRLSLAVAAAADMLADGAVFVSLVELASTERVVEAIAAAVGAEAVAGESLLEVVARRLAGVSMLLVLDNFEQVLDAAPVVSELLRRTAGVRVVVTSREKLSLYGEQVYQVPPLPLPDPAAGAGSVDVGGALREFPALALFEQRARAVDADFAVTAANLGAVTAVCRRLDGLPLAIELAAARSDEWDPGALLERLTDHLATLTGGARDLPARQRTLRGAIDWSVALLAPGDRELFARLAVFAGGCTAGSAGAVALPEVAAAEVAGRLRRLADKNLLTVAGEDGARFSMLETIRSYAVELLSAGPDDGAVRTRHGRYFGELAERAGEDFLGAQQAGVVRLLNREYPNLRAALSLAVLDGDAVAAARLCRGLWRYWYHGHHADEGREWLARTLALPDPPSGVVAGELCYSAAMLAHYRDDHEATQVAAELCLAHYTEAGDRRGMGRGHSTMGMAAEVRGDYPAALHHHGQSLARWRDAGYARGVDLGLGNLTRTALRLGDVDAAGAYLAERLALEGPDSPPHDRLLGLEEQIDVALLRGDAEQAAVLLAQSVPLSAELDDGPGAATALHQLGRVAMVRGRDGEALGLLTDALRRRQEQGLHEDIVLSLETVAQVVVAGDVELAAQLLAAAAVVRERHGLPVAPAQAGALAATVAAARCGPGFAEATAAGRSMALELLVQRLRDRAGALR